MTENERALLIACARAVLYQRSIAGWFDCDLALIDAVLHEQTHSVPFSPKIATDCQCRTCALARTRRDEKAEDVRIEDLI